MSNFKLIKTHPSKLDFELFNNLPKKLYPPKSQRFVLGFEPQLQHLEGCYVLMKNEEVCGRFAFYENPELQFEDSRAACIGSYECADEPEVSQALLEAAKNIAREKKHTWLIGPMEGSTWNNYRFSHNNEHPNFFLEPYHHDYYSQHFEKSGFKIIADYFSNLGEVQVSEPELLLQEKKYIAQNVTIRNLNPEKFEEEIRKIGAFSIREFSSNFLYTPITENDFWDKYAALKPLINPEFIFVAEDSDGELLAFSFSIQDHFSGNEKTLIVKSIARKKASTVKGLAAFLGVKTLQIAKEMNFKKVIHAYIKAENSSLLASKKYGGDAYKSYALYGFKL